MVNDPNHNEKSRYSIAQHRARKLIQECGSDLNPYHPEYDLEIFYRQRESGESEELFDYVKASPRPGPSHFVIVYDFGARTTHVRTDLRSKQNLDHIPMTTTQPTSSAIGPRR